MADLPDIWVLLKILSSENQAEACARVFADLDLNLFCLFLDGH
jgi:hypothetical protein